MHACCYVCNLLQVNLTDFAADSLRMSAEACSPQALINPLEIWTIRQELQSACYRRIIPAIQHSSLHQVRPPPPLLLYNMQQCRPLLITRLSAPFLRSGVPQQQDSKLVYQVNLMMFLACGM